MVEAREEHPVDFVLLVALGRQVAAKDFQPAVAFPDLFPEVGRLMAITQWIALPQFFPPGSLPLLNGRKKVLKPSSFVAICTSLLLTAK